VVAFFVISGYLMADISPKYSASTFLTHRVIRIYPAYLFCVILAGIYYAVLWQALRPDAGFIPNFKSMLLTGADPLALLRLTLVPIVFNDYPLGIEWTLLYETTFYVIIFAVSLVGAIKYLLPLALGWLALLMVVTMFYPLTQIGYTSPSLLTVLLFGINSAFIFGIVGRHIQHWVRPYPAFLLGVLLLAPMGAFPHPYTTIQLCAGTASLVLGLIALDRDGRLPEMPLLRALGGLELCAVPHPCPGDYRPLQGDGGPHSGPHCKRSRRLGTRLLPAGMARPYRLSVSQERHGPPQGDP